MTAQRGKHKNR